MAQDLQSIIDKLDALKGMVETHITATNIYRESQATKILEHEKTLKGNGRPGLETKVDRLERSEWIKNWIMGVVFAAIITMILNYFVQFLPGK